MVYGPPGHKQGRGTDPRVAEVLGIDVFRSDVLGLNGLDDRRQSQGVLAQAQEMADAVGAEHAFFSTCGSSLSVKTAMHGPSAGSPPRWSVPTRRACRSWRLTAEVVDHLRSGVAHGFLISDSADPSIETMRVLARP